jgi:glutamate racemase
MGIDTLVLGCTHYPLLKSVISAAVGPEITLIDSATETAKEVVSVLERLHWKRSGEGIRKYYVTDTPTRFEQMGKRFLGDSLLRAEQVKVGGT